MKFFRDKPLSFFVLEGIYWLVLGLLGFLAIGYGLLGEFLYVITIAFLIVIIGYSGFIESKKLIINTQKISIPSLPKLRLAVMSDLHLGPLKGELWFRRVIDKLSQENFDLLLIPGDFLEGSAEQYGPILKQLKSIKKPIYYTLGNHDYVMDFMRSQRVDHDRANKIRNILRQAGCQELQNSTVLLQKQQIWLVGVDDNSFCGQDDLMAAFQGVTDHSMAIFLAHSPDIVYELQKNSFHPALTICGHTHGGQVRLPWLGALPLIPARSGREYAKGWYPKVKMFVTSGLGESSLRMRFWNPPEIVILEIN